MNLLTWKRITEILIFLSLIFFSLKLEAAFPDRCGSKCFDEIPSLDRVVSCMTRYEPRSLIKGARCKLLEKPIFFACEAFGIHPMLGCGLVAAECGGNYEKYTNVMQIKSRFRERMYHPEVDLLVNKYFAGDMPDYIREMSEPKTPKLRKIVRNIIAGFRSYKYCLNNNYGNHYMAAMCYNLGDGGPRAYRNKKCRDHRAVLQLIKLKKGPSSVITRWCFPATVFKYARYAQSLFLSKVFEGNEYSRIWEIDEDFRYDNPYSPIHEYLARQRLESSFIVLRSRPGEFSFPPWMARFKYLTVEDLMDGISVMQLSEEEKI